MTSLRRQPRPHRPPGRDAAHRCPHRRSSRQTDSRGLTQFIFAAGCRPRAEPSYSRRPEIRHPGECRPGRRQLPPCTEPVMASMMHRTAGRERPGALLLPKLVFSTSGRDRSCRAPAAARAQGPTRSPPGKWQPHAFLSIRPPHRTAPRSAAGGGNHPNGPAFLPPRAPCPEAASRAAAEANLRHMGNGPTSIRTDR